MKKTLSLFLALFMIFAYSPFVFAAENAETSVVENNMEFATKVAEIIKDDNNMLRIIGKLKKVPSDNVFSLAEETVISQDGRFVLQFSNEKDLSATALRISCMGNLNVSGMIFDRVSSSGAWRLTARLYSFCKPANFSIPGT